MRYGSQLKMVGDEQGLPSMSDSTTLNPSTAQTIRSYTHKNILIMYVQLDFNLICLVPEICITPFIVFNSMRPEQRD